MFKDAQTFCSFSVDDIEKAQQFYSQTLGLDATIDDTMGLLNVKLAGGGQVMVYPKSDHQAASYTVFNILVSDIEASVSELTNQGVHFVKYDTEQIKTNDQGISEGQGPRIAWFKDPAGNILSVIEDKSA